MIKLDMIFPKKSTHDIKFNDAKKYLTFGKK